MIAEAIDAAFTVGWALLAWIVLTAVFATAALYTVVAVAWWVWRAVRALMPRRALSVRFSRPLRRPAALASTETLPAPPVPTPALPPSWARTDTEEAA